MQTRKFLLLLALAAMPLLAGAQRRSMSILGDSYSTFEGYLQPDTNEVWYHAVPDLKRTDVRDVRETWWWQLASRNGLKLCRNNSYSGATISYRGYRGEDYRRRSFVTRLADLGCPDIIFVFGATNDEWARVPLGEYMYENWPDSALYTFRPAMAKMLEGLQLHYPSVEVVVLVNHLLSDALKESMHVICEHYGVRWIDLEDVEMKAGHPTVKGQRQICEQIEKNYELRVTN